MYRFTETTRRFIVENQLFEPGDRLLLAVSGGIDSMVMAEFLNREGYDLAVAHVNYQLRGDASEEDAAFVRNWALTHGAKYFGIAVDVTTNKASSESTQMAARRVRYEYFQKILDEYEFNYVLTAHHLDDHLETTLINLIRGTGLRGLASLPFAEGQIRRPLLNTTREAIMQYAKAHDICWREDESNAKGDYLRNSIRYQLTPTLKELGFTSAAYRNTARHLQLARKLFEERVSQLQTELIFQNGSQTKVLLQDNVKITEQLDLLHEILPTDWFTRDQYRQVLTADRTLVLQAGERRLWRQNDALYIDNHHYPVQAALTPREILDLPTSITSAGVDYRLELIPKPVDLRATNKLFVSASAAIDQPGNPATCRLQVRARIPGDKLRPLGLGGQHKKLKDVLIDRKIPREDRDAYAVITSPNGEIFAIPGLLVTHDGRVRSEDTHVVCISPLAKKF